MKTSQINVSTSEIQAEEENTHTTRRPSEQSQKK